MNLAFLFAFYDVNDIDLPASILKLIHFIFNSRFNIQILHLDSVIVNPFNFNFKPIRMVFQMKKAISIMWVPFLPAASKGKNSRKPGSNTAIPF